MTLLTGEVESQPVLEVLDKILDLGGQNAARPAMKEIAGYMENQVRLGFRRSQSPYGEAWAPITHRQGQPLIDNRILLGSINSAYGADFAEVGTNTEYAPIHQFGGRTGRNRSAEITARPYLPIEGDEVRLPDHWEDRIVDILNGLLGELTSG